jgi:hypothetical protein
MVLRLDNPAGGEDTIRVGLRGAAVDARIELGGDAGAAERMHAHVGELRRALEQKGLETEALRVRAAAARPAAELVDAARIAAATLDDAATRTATRSNADGSTPRERGHGAPDPEARRDSHSSRQRSRQNPQEGDLT